MLWSPLVTGAFDAATQYTAIITLTANPGYTFAGVAANSFTVAGATSVRNAKNSGTVTAAFPTTAGTAGEPAVVDIAAIPGVALPATYAAPVTAIGVTEQYTGTVSWSPLVTGTFAPYKAYTATIRLRANPGFTFAGVAADFFTVAGATSASNAANSYTVTAAFPATGGIPVTVSIAAIPGVTAPLTYETPVAAIAETAQYTGTVAWSPEVSGAFAAETEYTATITLEAKAGFTFDGVAAGFFTVAGAASVGNAAYSGTIMATFPAIPFMEMVPVSGGTFTMGSPAGEPSRSSEETQHSVTLGGFSIGKYEVMQGQYRDVMGTNPSSFRTATNGENPARRPVESVSWYDAVEFCNRLSEREGLTPYYVIDKTNSDPNNTNSNDNYKWLVTPNPSANGYRLPTEAQWEYACRAGTTTPFNFHDGTSWGSSQITTGQANFDGTSNLYNGSPAGVYRSRTIPVGSFAPNEWGLYDMHGNVYEWCWDWYGSLSSAAQADPSGPVSGSYWVLRGGSWLYDGQYLRSA